LSAKFRYNSPHLKTFSQRIKEQRKKRK